MPYSRAASSSRMTPISAIALIGAFFFSILSAVSPVGAVSVSAGFKDHVYGADASDPTADKPQSKVWFTDGSWWAGMYVGDPEKEYRIHRYNPATNQWSDTGVAIDPRDSSHADYLWDGATNSLYVASVNGDEVADAILVYKLTYNPSTDLWAHDSAFTSAGVQVGLGPTKTVTIAKDSTGQLWVTFQNDSIPGDPTSAIDIMVNRSLAGEHVWGTPFSIGEANEDDISAIIAFGGDSVGVMWSDQNPADNQTFFYFSTHADSGNDTTWSTKQSSAQGTDDFADDHVNLKLAATSSGQVLAAVKTNGGPNHIQVLKRNASTGAWTNHVVVGDAQDATRPQLVVDETNGRVYVFYTSPVLARDGDQAIYYKSAPLNTLSFTTSGLGTPFIQDGANDINNISTSKHNVTSATGLVAIASSDTNDTYYHGYLTLGGASHPFTDIDGHPFEDEIIWLYNEGITKGCSPTTFCPDQSVIRGQMASFLVRALDLPSTDEDFFTDDEGSTYENDINALAESGITKGCSPTTFCPNAAVTRQQMASFLVRAFDLPPTDEDFFTDDTGSTHENDINALAESGITTGCSPTTFCPLQAVTRGQMAAFLFRAFE